MIQRLNENEIKKFLLRNSFLFNPPLNERLDLVKYANKLSSHSIHFINVNKSNNIICFAACYFNDLKNRRAFLSFICVDFEFKRQGLGRKLLDEVFEYGKEMGFNEILLEVDKNNHKAFEFYLNLLFKIVEVRNYSYLMSKIF